MVPCGYRFHVAIVWVPCGHRVGFMWARVGTVWVPCGFVWAPCGLGVGSMWFPYNLKAHSKPRGRTNGYCYVRLMKLELPVYDKCALMDSLVIATDQNGVIILVYFPSFISSRCTRKTASAMETLLSSPGLPAPLRDVCQTHLDTVRLNALYGPRRYGLLHCATSGLYVIPLCCFSDFDHA